MTGWNPSYPRPGLLRRMSTKARGMFAVAIWGGAIAGLIALGRTLPSGERFPGIVDAARSTITAPVDGRLSAVLVTLHQEVTKGQVIARLDDTDLRLKLDQATYELERLRADIARRSADLSHKAQRQTKEHGLDASVEQRRLVSTVEACEVEALSTRASLEETRVRAQGAGVEVERLSGLFAKGVVAEPELIRIRTEHDALERRIKELEALHKQQLERVQTAKKRLTAFEPGELSDTPVESLLAPVRWRLKSQETALERIAYDAKLLVLHAPISGRVQAVSAKTDEWISAGRAIASIVDPRPHQILAYVPDAMRSKLSASTPWTISREDQTVLGTTQVVSISATTVPMPQQLWRDPRREEWAYEVVLAPTGAESVGERLQLSFAP